jgi:hypothetical protein
MWPAAHLPPQAASGLLAAGLSAMVALGAAPALAEALPAPPPDAEELVAEERSRVEYGLQLQETVRKAELAAK